MLCRCCLRCTWRAAARSTWWTSFCRARCSQFSCCSSSAFRRTPARRSRSASRSCWRSPCSCWCSPTAFLARRSTFPYSVSSRLPRLFVPCGLRGVMRPWFDFWFRLYIYCLLVYILCFPTYLFASLFPYLSPPLLIFFPVSIFDLGAICIVCLFISYASPLILFSSLSSFPSFLFTPFLTYLFLFRFQAGCSKRRLNLALVFVCLFCLVVHFVWSVNALGLVFFPYQAKRLA